MRARVREAFKANTEEDMERLEPTIATSCEKCIAFVAFILLVIFVNLFAKFKLR